MSGPAKHRLRVREDALPGRMREVLASMRANRRRRTAPPRQARIRAISTALRGLVEAARAKGLNENLNAVSVAAYESALRSRGVPEPSIAAMLGELRLYARYCGDGLDWARDTRKDFRTLPEVLSARHWQPMRNAAEELALSGAPLADFKLVDRWLQIRPAMVTEDDVLAFTGGSAKIANALASMIGRLDPVSADNVVYAAVRHRLHRAAREKRKVPGPGSGRKPTMSVTRNELPVDIHNALDRLGCAVNRGGRKLSRATVSGIEIVVRQLLFFCKGRALADPLSRDALRQFFRQLDERGLKSRTRSGYANRLATFARHFGPDEEVIRRLRNEAIYLEHHAPPTGAAKLERLAERPMTLTGVAQAARQMFLQAQQMPATPARQRAFLVAAVLAVLALMPKRSIDIRTWRLDQQLRRMSEGWFFAAAISKTGAIEYAALHPKLTPYLDGAVTLGAEASAFWDLYHRAIGLPWLRKVSGEGWSEGWLWRNVSAAIGHPPHLARSLLHDHADGMADGNDIPNVLCGHQNPRVIGRFYKLDRGGKKHARAQEAIARLPLQDDDGPPDAR